MLFGVLVGFTSLVDGVRRRGAARQPGQPPRLLAEQLIKRGVIRADDGEVLAGSRALSQKRYGRRYPTGALFAHAVGCTSLDRGRSGLEDYYNDPLTGRRTELIGAVDSLLGPQNVGDDLRTTLDPKAQKVATTALPAAAAGRGGGDGAQDGRGARCWPPSRRSTRTPRGEFRGANRHERFNLATQGRFPPGSTMKTVTAAAALDTGKFAPGSRVNGKNGKDDLRRRR